MNDNAAGNRSERDVRMRGFACRSPVTDVVTWLRGHASLLPAEVVGLRESAGRVLAADAISQVNVPSFARAMMDGYALRAADTVGASCYNQLAAGRRR
jgi:molybdopterin molybdotransferase